MLKAEAGAILRLLAELQECAATRFTGEAVAQVARAPTIVLAIDQIEELFATEGSEEARAFLRVLATCLKHAPDTIVLATIRTDRYGELQKVATELGFPVVHPFDLGPITPFVFQEAITGPARRAAPPIKVDPQLTQQLMQDMAAQGADPLPLLAFTLERLYRDFARVEGHMSLEQYERLGGLAGSIEAAVKQAFARPEMHPAIPDDPLARNRLLESVFVPALVDINEANNEPVRRIASAAEVPAAGLGLVDRLVEARLLVRGVRITSVGGSEPTVEVAHEALLRQWSTLRGILDQRSSDLRELRALERSAEAWSRSQVWGGNRHLQRAVQRLDGRLGSLSAFVASRKRDLRDLFRGSEWLEHKGERLLAAERLLARPDFAARMQITARYLNACRRSQSFARREQRRRLSGAALVIYALLFTSWVAVLAAASGWLS